MSKTREYNVKLAAMGILEPELHYGIYARHWWTSRPSEKNQNTEKFLIPIRPGQKSIVILNQRQFTIRIVKLLDNNIYIPGYCAESLELSSEISISSTAAITSLYQQLFNKNTKFSGPLLLGWDDNEIIKELSSDVCFFPFSISYNKLNIFIHGIGVSNKLELKNAGDGYHATILHFYKKKRSYFHQFIQNNTCKIQIICENRIEVEYTDNTPQTVWEKVWNDSKVLYEYNGITLFGINSSKTQQQIEDLKRLTCTTTEWNNQDQMNKLYNYYIKRHIKSSNINWYKLFLTWIEKKITIIELYSELSKIYPLNYKLKNEEIGRWKTFLKAVGCSNIASFTTEESKV
ncbi:hypothetical protein C2G38_2137968 [Gigaspora rosea]|uniref:Uncharacterized protein n=1 Tax=Gigaspora rosea TaxID=44941 RepID=A0A397W6Z0_9GLOM|nr:hypothetical protein C2G38_2137968 [Gigaspora rosea]